MKGIWLASFWSSLLITVGTFDLCPPEISYTASINDQQWQTTTLCSTLTLQKMNYPFSLLSPLYIMFVGLMYLITWSLWIVFIYFGCLVYYYYLERELWWYILILHGKLGYINFIPKECIALLFINWFSFTHTIWNCNTTLILGCFSCQTNYMGECILEIKVEPVFRSELQRISTVDCRGFVYLHLKRTNPHLLHTFLSYHFNTVY